MNEQQLLTTATGKQVELTKEQAEVVELAISTNWTQARIAEHLGRNATWVSNTLRKQHVREAINGAIQDGMLLGAAKAFRKVNELIDHKSGYVALEASKDMLDRAGFKPVDRSLNTNLSGEVVINIDLGG